MAVKTKNLSKKKKLAFILKYRRRKIILLLGFLSALTF